MDERQLEMYPVMTVDTATWTLTVAGLVEVDSTCDAYLTMIVTKPDYSSTTYTGGSFSLKKL